MIFFEAVFRSCVYSGPDGIRLDRKELAAAEWHPRTGLPDGLTDISIAYEMIEALRL